MRITNYKTIICDIDGVILKCKHSVDIEDFYNNIFDCYPVDSMVDLINGLYSHGYNIIFLTARDAKCRYATLHQLKECFKFPIKLYMRLHNDIREDWVIKEEYLKLLQTEHNIVLALDDNEGNCQMFSRNGIPTLKILN